mgnify:CR=1 FL=1
MQGRAVIRKMVFGSGVPQHQRETGDALCQLSIDSGTIGMTTPDAAPWTPLHRLHRFVRRLRFTHTRQPETHVAMSREQGAMDTIRFVRRRQGERVVQ